MKEYAEMSYVVSAEAVEHDNPQQPYRECLTLDELKVINFYRRLSSADKMFILRALESLVDKQN
jgi:hypothetical protein